MSDLRDTHAAARMLGLESSTLVAWRSARRGPPFVRLGRAVRYRVADIEAYIRANRVAI